MPSWAVSSLNWASCGSNSMTAWLLLLHADAPLIFCLQQCTSIGQVIGIIEEKTITE